MFKFLLELFLSLFKKGNEQQTETNNEKEEPVPDEHIIVVENEPTTEETDDTTYIINEEEIMETQETLEILLERAYLCNDYTIGKFFIDDEFFSDTIEDKDRDLYDTMSVEEILKKKVYGKTAIPIGRYEIKMTFSQKFSTKVWGKKYNGMVPEIMNVKGYSGVRIHPLNTAKDSLGCIGPGRNLEKGKVLNSTEYYYNLLDNYILPSLDSGKRVFLTVIKK